MHLPQLTGKSHPAARDHVYSEGGLFPLLEPERCDAQPVGSADLGRGIPVYRAHEHKAPAEREDAVQQGVLPLRATRGHRVLRGPEGNRKGVLPRHRREEAGRPDERRDHRRGGLPRVQTAGDGAVGGLQNLQEVGDWAFGDTKVGRRDVCFPERALKKQPVADE